MPIFNVEAYLPQCINSLISQTIDNIEIILVNDGSSDNCPAICNHYAATCSKITVIHQQNKGLVRARKTGLMAASGEYIGYVDGDDWVEPKMYEDMLINAMKHQADIVISGHKEELAGQIVEIAKNAVCCGVYKDKKLIKNIYSNMLYFGKFSKFGVYSYVWNKIFHRSILIKNQMQIDDDIFIGEDAACTYPTLLDASTVCVTDSSYYHYRQRPDSSVKILNNSIKDMLNLNLLYSYLKRRFSESDYSDILLPQLDYFILSLLTVRAEGIKYEDKPVNKLYFFPNVKIGSRVLICGAGTFGQHLHRRLQDCDDFRIAGWVDDLYYLYNKFGLDVKPLSYITETCFDYIVIAFIDETFTENMYNKIINMNISKNKIAKVSHYSQNISKLISGYGIKN